MSVYKKKMSGLKRKYEESEEEITDSESMIEESSDDGNETDDSIVDNTPIQAPPPLNEQEEINLALQEGQTFAQNLDSIEKNGRVLRKPKEKKEDPFKIEVARVQLLDQIKLIHKEIKQLIKENKEELATIELPKMPSFKTPYAEIINLHTQFEELYSRTMELLGEEEEEEEESEDEDDETSSFNSSDEDEDTDDESSEDEES